MRKNYQAETMGEFSVRGGIIDIFPLTEKRRFESNFGAMRWIPSVRSRAAFRENLEKSILSGIELVWRKKSGEMVSQGFRKRQKKLQRSSAKR